MPHIVPSSGGGEYIWMHFHEIKMFLSVYSLTRRSPWNRHGSLLSQMFCGVKKNESWCSIECSSQTARVSQLASFHVLLLTGFWSKPWRGEIGEILGFGFRDCISDRDSFGGSTWCLFSSNFKATFLFQRSYASSLTAETHGSPWMMIHWAALMNRVTDTKMTSGSL